MIEVIEDEDADMFESGCLAVVNPINIYGVSGAGLALLIRKRFPVNEQYVQHIVARTDGLLPLGRVICYVPDRVTSGTPMILNVPTKMHYRDPSKIDYVVQAAKGLADVANQRKLKSVAVPALGCGLGGLDWKTVRPALEEAFATAAETNWKVYAPREKDHRPKLEKKKKWPQKSQATVIRKTSL